MMIRLLKMSLILSAIVLALAAVNASAQRAGELRLEPYTFEAENGQRVEAELGRFSVPENRQNPRSRLIELAFVRFRATSNNAASPIIYLAGGPGGSGISTARGRRFPLFMAMREFGDVIALDQRGVGMSQPNLTCRESWNFPLDRAGAPEETLRIAQERSSVCANHWRNQGVELTGYNTNESADDLEALRRALGARKMSLWGTSYGTHLALATIKRHAVHIDRAILAGVEGLDDTYKLPSNIQSHLVMIGERVRADANLSRVVPDFLGLMRTVFERVEREPITVAVNDPQTRQSVQVTIGKFDLQLLTMTQVLGDVQTISALPLLYYAMSRGDFSVPAQQLLQLRRARIGSAMSFMMDCASGVSAQRLARIRRGAQATLLGDAANFPFPAICSAWGSLDLGSNFRTPVRSSVPTLFISGTLDGRTPPSNAETVRRGFRRSVHLIIENAGHDDLFISTPQILETIRSFMRDASLPPTINASTTQPFRFRQLNSQ